MNKSSNIEQKEQKTSDETSMNICDRLAVQIKNLERENIVLNNTINELFAQNISANQGRIEQIVEQLSSNLCIVSTLRKRLLSARKFAEDL